MNYDEDYFNNIERHAPFSFLSPITKRSRIFKVFVLKLINLSEKCFATTRAGWITRRLNPRSSLDIGTGGGKLVQELLKRKVDAYGIDISQFQIDNLPSTLKHRILLADIDKLPYENKKFDVVSAYQVLEHIETTKLYKSLQEVALVSRQYIIFELPTRENYNANIDPSHVSVFSYIKWLSIMNKALGNEWRLSILKKPNYIRPFFIVFAEK